MDPPGAGGEAGRVTFTPYFKDGTRTHKATNIDSIPFHNVSFLLNSRAPHKTTPSTRNGRPSIAMRRSSNAAVPRMRPSRSATSVRSAVRCGFFS